MSVMLIGTFLAITVPAYLALLRGLTWLADRPQSYRPQVDVSSRLEL